MSHRPSAISSLSVGVDLVEVRRVEPDRRALRRAVRPARLHRARAGGLRDASGVAGGALGGQRGGGESAWGRGSARSATWTSRWCKTRRGCPHVHLHGRAAALAEALGLTRWARSILHDGGMAIAFVVAM